MGDGNRVKFWQDVWCGDCPLNEVFPELYSIRRSKESSVVEVICFSDGRL